MRGGEGGVKGGEEIRRTGRGEDLEEGEEGEEEEEEERGQKYCVYS